MTTLDQLKKNYQTAFPDETTPNYKGALEFTSLLLAEIGETCPNTNIARAASVLNHIIGETLEETSKLIEDYQS